MKKDGKVTFKTDNIMLFDFSVETAKECGWNIEAPVEGADILMDGGMAYFICNNCCNVYRRTFKLGYEDEISMNCPKCKSHNTDNWKPGKICPECGGELEDLGVSCWED